MIHVIIYDHAKVEMQPILVKCAKERGRKSASVIRFATVHIRRVTRRYCINADFYSSFL
jgi:hypothetical protein